MVDQRELSAFETTTAVAQRRFVRFNMKGTGTNASTLSTAFLSTHAFSRHTTVPHDIETRAHSHNLRLTDQPGNSENLPIEILIGSNHDWKIFKDTPPVRLSQSVVLLPSKLGWILGGNRSAVTASSFMVNYVNLGFSSFTSDDVVFRFWDLEALGITEKQHKSMNVQDMVLLWEFLASYSLEYQRRVVPLPRKANTTLPSNHLSFRGWSRDWMEMLFTARVSRSHIGLHKERKSGNRSFGRGNIRRVILTSSCCKEEKNGKPNRVLFLTGPLMKTTHHLQTMLPRWALIHFRKFWRNCCDSDCIQWVS